MATAHARKKTGRHSFSKTTSGQAASAPRKQLRKLQNWFARSNDAQIRQNQTDCTIIVHGVDDWKSIFKGKRTTVYPEVAKYFGGESVSMLDCFRVESDLNVVSYERTVLSAFISMGYTLEALEVEFDAPGRSGWGKCIWYKEHPSYSNPSENLKKMFPKAGAVAFSFVSSIFKTQHAGDQKFTLCSMQMMSAELIGQKNIGFLFHKTLIFRKAILLPPVEQEKVMAKAA